MDAIALQGGFASAPRDAAYAFRAAMSAMARPGRIETILGATPPAPLSSAAGTLILTLCDPETPLYLAGSYDTDEIRSWITFHTGAPLADPENCHFAVGQWESLLPLESYAKGTPEYPDRSATLIVECDTLKSEEVRLTGPGIQDEAYLALPEKAAFQANTRLFPLGLDFFFTAGTTLAALPRTTQVS